jgi:hypothetical protein
MTLRVLEFPTSHQLPEPFVRALQQVFDNDPLHEAVQEELELGWHETHELIMELAFFFFVCYRYRGVALAVPPRLDPAWHVFLKRKQEYEEYCLSCFGGIIEHLPYEEGVTRQVEVGKTLTCVGITFGGKFARRWSGKAKCDGVFKAAA